MTDKQVLKVQYTDTYRSLDLPPLTAPRDGDAGYDLHGVEAVTLAQGEQSSIATGVHLEIPAGYVGLVKDRSSMAKRGLVTSGGVIDSGYRGEVLVLLRNLSDAPQTLTIGERIAQLLLIPVLTVPVVEADLSDTERGAGGFGSTGKK